MSWGTSNPGKHDSSARGSPSLVSERRLLDLHVWWLEKQTKSCPICQYGDGSWESWWIMMYCGRKSKFTRSASKQKDSTLQFEPMRNTTSDRRKPICRPGHTSKCGRDPHREVLAEKIGPQILRFLLKSCKHLSNPKPPRRAMRQSSNFLLQSPWPLSPHASE